MAFSPFVELHWEIRTDGLKFAATQETGRMAYFVEPLRGTPFWRFVFSIILSLPDFHRDKLYGELSA